MPHRFTFTILLSILIALSVVPLTQASNSNPPEWIYLTWSEEDALHTINISWRARENYIGEVRYDTVPCNSDPAAYRYSASGDPNITPVTYEGLEGYIHHVELDGLDPGTTYYFIVGNPESGWSSEHRFRTPNQDTKKFVVGGDSRSGGPDWPEARDTMTQVMASYDPEFVIFTGDFVRKWDDQWEWDNWFRAWYLYARTTDNRLIPIIPAVGNHEVFFPQPTDYDPETQATNYYSQFNLPGNERWYSVDFGDFLHIIVLDSEVRAHNATWENQLEWLQDDLEKHRNDEWIIVAFHRPPYCSGKYFPGDSSFLKEWLELFDLYGVDFVFSAHDHGYERTGPINNLKNPTGFVSPDEGRIYVVSAGWGAPLYPGGKTWFTAPELPGHIENYNVVIMEIDGNSALMKAVSDLNQVIDEYQIVKEEPISVPILYLFLIFVAIAAVTIFLFLFLRRR